MVTNINLVSPENEKKPALSGKGTLILSLILIFLSGVTFSVVKVFSNKYVSQSADLQREIDNEKMKIRGPEFANLADFQQRVILLNRIIDNHVYFDAYLKSLSKYVMPDVRFDTFSWTKGENVASITGTATNYDALAKELTLLRNFPLVESMDFKNASESPATETHPSGVVFALTLKLKKEAFKK